MSDFLSIALFALSLVWMEAIEGRGVNDRSMKRFTNLTLYHEYEYEYDELLLLLYTTIPHISAY